MMQHLASAAVSVGDQWAAVVGEAVPVVLVLGAVALYVAWFYGFDRERLEATARRAGLDGSRARNRAVLHARWAGFGVLGGGMVLLELSGGVDRLLAGARDMDPIPTLIGGLGLGVVFGVAAAVSARKPTFHDRYPEIRGPLVTPSTRNASFLAWAVYLAGYEYLFRGALLFGLAETWGVAAALAVTTALYVLAHLHKNGAETASCFVVGCVFGAAALATGSFVVAWIAHVIVAIASEASATSAHSDIAYGRPPEA